ncbi:hypothetical protein ACP4OV_002132 [Aristida adscensionis]
MPMAPSTMPRAAASRFSLRVVPVDGGGFLHRQATLQPHVSAPRGLTYSVDAAVGTGAGRRTYSLMLDTEAA